MMRLMILAFLLVFSSVAVAQMSPGMQEAMTCMQSIDQDALMAFGERGEEVSREIKALCKSGDESEALEVAMAYAKDMEDDKNIEALKRCSELMREAMPGMQMPEIPSAETFEDQEGSICDNIN